MYDIVTIGTATRDILLVSSKFKAVRDPEHLSRSQFPTGAAECLPWGGKVEVERPIIAVGGGAANTAVTFARQGLRAVAIVKLGQDESGRETLKDLKAAGVSVLPSLDKKKGTAASVIMLAQDGERTILSYHGASHDLSVKDVPASLRAKWLYVVPGSISSAAIRTIISRFKAQGARIAMNPSRHYLEMGQHLSVLKDLDVIILNREEATYLTGCRYEDEVAIITELGKMVSGVKVVTDGPRGVTVTDGKDCYRAGIYPGKIVDRTGAGDAFGSGFVAGLIRGQISDIEYAIKLGSANATAVVEVVGAHVGALTRREFEKNRRWQKFEVSVRKLT